MNNIGKTWMELHGIAKDETAWMCLSIPAIRYREPEFEPGPGKVTHRRGEKARLYCSVKHLGERTVVWRKVPNTNPLTIGTTTWIDDARISIEHKNSQWDLVIEGVTSYDSGEYECQISISKKLLRHVVELYVTENSSGQVKRNPEIVISGTQLAARGDNITLNCNASKGGNPRRMLIWFKGSQEIAEDEDRISLSYSDSRNVQIVEYVSSHLHIENARTTDAGLYTCQARDEKLMTSVYVNVLTGGSNNVKRAGSSPGNQESVAVISFQSAIAHSTLILFMLLIHHAFT